MKLSCKIVEDLLPLYQDAVCSEESRSLVEEHIKECDNCKYLLSKMGDESTSTPPAIDDSAPIKSISDKWTKSKKTSFLKGSVIAVMICAVILGGYYGLTRWKCIPVSADVLEVSEVSQLSDGRIIYHLNVTDDKNLYFIKFTTNEDGSYYITPMRSIIESKRTSNIGLFNEYFMVDISETNAYQQSYGDGIVITSCYIGPEDNAILIWEDGMELPSASDALEEMVK